MKIYLPAVLMAALLALPRTVCSADYKGAGALLKTLNADAAPPGDLPPINYNDSEAKIRHDLEAFRKAGPTLPPAVAAKDWVDLAVRFIQHDLSYAEMDTEQNQAEPFSFTLVVAALPPPAAWDEIERLVEKIPVPKDNYDWQIRTLTLKALAHRLNRNTGAIPKDLDVLESAMKTAYNPPIEDDVKALDSLKNSIASETNPGAVVFKDQEDTVSQWKQTDDTPPGTLYLSDLVQMVGKEKAFGLLCNAMILHATISVDGGEETRQLARDVALELVKPMKVPQWGLAQSLDGMKLYEALLKKFPPPKAGTQDPLGGYVFENNQWHPALNMYYLLGLIGAHRMDEADAYALQFEGRGFGETDHTFTEEIVGGMDDGVKMPEYVVFFHDLLAKNPNLPFWSYYANIAPLAGKRKEMTALLESTLQQKGLNDQLKKDLHSHLRDAWLADDRIDDVVALERKEGGSEEWLYWLGSVLDRKDLLKPPLPPLPEPDPDFDDAIFSAEKLAEAGHPLEAEALMEKIAPKAISADQKRAMEWALVVIYADANRPADVLKILNEGRYLGVADAGMAATAGDNATSNYYGSYLANAFAATGHKDVAAKILAALIDVYPDCDPAYELLIKIQPREQALAMLDFIAARNPYGAMAFTWKARVLSNAKQYEQAEAAARHAIALDSLDAFAATGKGLLPYTVLADIREARGDKKEAETLRGVVTGLGICDDANQLAQEGLLSRAIKRYQEALTHFENSFRIHFALAMCQERYGDRAGAEENFRRAFELVPARFQYLSTRNGPHAEMPFFFTLLSRDTGDKVIPGLIKQHPDAPQLHYLLATLRYDEHRYTEALAEAREATRLDPGYLEAWVAIMDLCKQLYLPSSNWDVAASHIIQLDPQQSGKMVYTNELIDLKTAWATFETVRKLHASDWQNIYPLSAAAREIKQEQIDYSKRPYYPPTGPTAFVGKMTHDPLDPGYVISENTFIQELITLLDRGRENLAIGVPAVPWHR